MAATRWVDVEGATLAADVSASPARAQPLVFLHAGVADKRMWHAQWAAFAPERALLRYDRRGYGETRTNDCVPYARVADLWAVMDSAGLARAVLVGCSQGGRVALDAALARPDRVAGLVLVAPAVGGAPPADLSGPVLALDQAIDAADEAGHLERVNQLEAHLWLDGPGSTPGRVEGEARQLFLAMNGIALHAADPGPATDADDAWGRLTEIHVPTLVLWGDLDLPHLQARCAELVRRIPHARHEVLAGTAHLPGLEAPERFNQALAAYLGELEAGDI